MPRSPGSDPPVAPLWRSGKIRLMKLLAIETSTELGSVALWRDGEVLRRGCPAGTSHSETLLPRIRSILDESALDFPDLDGIAFASGPGAFTGLRMACAVAQGIAVAHDLPVIPIGTLAAMSLASGGERVIVALDARMGEVYYGLFIAGEALQPECVCLPAQVPVPDSSGWLACGNGLTAHPGLRDRLSACVRAWQPELMPDAGAVAILAVARLTRGQGIDAAAAAPYYVRNKVAQTVAERIAHGGKA